MFIKQYYNDITFVSLFNGKLTFLGYSMLKPIPAKNSNEIFLAYIYIYIYIYVYMFK